MANSFSIRPVQAGDEDNIYRLLTLDGPSGIPEDDPRHPLHETEALIAASRDPAAKGGGWLAIVDAREQFMRAQGQTEARADIKATNAASLRMFSKLGYQFNAASQAKLDAWNAEPDDKNVPVLILTKKLSGLEKSDYGGLSAKSAFTNSSDELLAARLAQEKLDTERAAKCGREEQAELNEAQESSRQTLCLGSKIKL